MYVLSKRWTVLRIWVCFFDSQLTFSENIHQKINKAYSMLGIIKRNLIHMDPRTFILLYKTLVRPHNNNNNNKVKTWSDQVTKKK